MTICPGDLHTQIIVLIIGFDPDVYEVDEDAGTVRLFVEVLNGTISEERTIPITISTANDSAQGILH